MSDNLLNNFTQFLNYKIDCFHTNIDHFIFNEVYYFDIEEYNSMLKVFKDITSKKPSPRFQNYTLNMEEFEANLAKEKYKILKSKLEVNEKENFFSPKNERIIIEKIDKEIDEELRRKSFFHRYMAQHHFDYTNEKNDELENIFKKFEKINTLLGNYLLNLKKIKIFFDEPKLGKVWRNRLRKQLIKDIEYYFKTYNGEGSTIENITLDLVDEEPFGTEELEELNITINNIEYVLNVVQFISYFIRLLQITYKGINNFNNVILQFSEVPFIGNNVFTKNRGLYIFKECVKSENLGISQSSISFLYQKMKTDKLMHENLKFHILRDWFLDIYEIEIPQSKDLSERNVSKMEDIYYKVKGNLHPRIFTDQV